MISFWLTSFTSSSTGSVQSSTENQTKSAGVYIKIDSVKSLGGYTGTSNTNTTVIYSNPSSQTISSISLISNGGETFYGTTTSLSPAGVGTAYLNLTSGTEILIKGLCQSSVAVEGKCKSTDTCWEA
jgi:hypothetical protein